MHILRGITSPISGLGVTLQHRAVLQQRDEIALGGQFAMMETRDGQGVRDRLAQMALGLTSLRDLPLLISSFGYFCVSFESSICLASFSANRD